MASLLDESCILPHLLSENTWWVQGKMLDHVNGALWQSWPFTANRTYMLWEQWKSNQDRSRREAVAGPASYELILPVANNVLCKLLAQREYELGRPNANRRRHLPLPSARRQNLTEVTAVSRNPLGPRLGCYRRTNEHREGWQIEKVLSSDLASSMG